MASGKVSKIVGNISKPINTSAILILAALTLSWGLFVIVPWFSVLGATPSFSFMLDLLPEWMWGVAAIVSGLVMTRGVIKNSYKSLTHGALVGFYFWLIVSISCWVGAWAAGGGLVFGFIAIYCAFIYINIKTNRHVLPLTETEPSRVEKITDYVSLGIQVRRHRS